MKSANKDLRITWPASCPGLGLSICPGKIDALALSGPCRRNLWEDLETIRKWGAKHMVSLLEQAELEYLRVPNLGEAALRAGMIWHHWPVLDGSALRLRWQAGPDPWREECRLFLRELAAGEKIFIHCRGGLGRTGTLAARLLIEMGLEPHAAIGETRRVRPGAVETREQESYLLEKKWLRP